MSAFLAFATAVPALVYGPPAEAQTSQIFDIAPQSLESALVAFATQARVALSLPTIDLERRTSPGVRGAYRTDDALNILLSGSGYTFERVSLTAYRIIAIPPPRPSPAITSPGLDEPTDVVIVSARIPATEADLPRDISRIGGDRLVDAGVTSDADLASEINGLSFTNLGGGRNKILLRGLSDGALSGRSQSLVGLYFGDTRLTYGAPDPDLQLVDVASVEVLRGPQGALYGAGAIGGIMRIEPNPVDLDTFGGSVLASAGNIESGDLSTNVEFVLNAPVVPGVVGVRGAVYRESMGGWLDNDQTGGRNTNSLERNGLRLTALARLDSVWSVEARVMSQNITSDDSQYLEQSPDGETRLAALLEPHENDIGLGSVTVRGATDWGDITSSTAYVRHRFSSRFDATGTFANFGAAPDAIQPIDESDALRIWVHETRLSSRRDAGMPWFVGLFYADGDSTRHVALRDGAYGVWNQLDYEETRADAVDELAMFGEVSWRVTPQIALSAGLRFFRSNLDMQSSTVEPLLSRSASASGRLTSTGAAPDVRLLYKLSPDVMFHMSAARGYRAGGLNSGGAVGEDFSSSAQPFAQYSGDDIWTYEAGARADLFDGRLALRITGFQSAWRNIQTDELISHGFTYSGNVGDARSKGVEFDVRYAPIDGVGLRLNGLVNEPEISSPSQSFPTTPDGGLPGSPEFQGGATARYTWRAAVGTLGLDLFTEVQATYVGRSNFGFSSGIPIGEYVTLKARFGVSAGDWQLQLYGENLTDSHGSTYSFGNPYQFGRNLRTPLQPRTLGISLRHNF